MKFRLSIFLFTFALVFAFTADFGSVANAQTDIERKEAALEKKLKEIEAEIAKNQTLLRGKQQESSSLQRDIDILTYEINQANLKIQAKQIEIQRLGGDIEDRVEYIGDLSKKIEEEKMSLAELLRKTRELDDISALEVVLANNDLSEMFTDLNSFHFVQQKMHNAFAAIRNNQAEASQEKVVLEVQRSGEIDARKVIEQERETVRIKEKEKQRLLSITKSEEQTYQQILAQREAERQAIRSALFQLRDVKGISFGEAYDLASSISKKVGVRTELILAIVTQESNLGENVGTCNRPGDGPEKSWRVIMPGPNDGHRSYRDDQTLFLQITKELGLDPDGTPLSCPWGNGWGGAMGPSQFIPTTWNSYKHRISAVTGNTPPNPWDPVDAFTATGLLLADLGANAGGYTKEREAALRYYAGGNWNKPSNAFYGDSVLQIASGYEQQIKVLQNL